MQKTLVVVDGSSYLFRAYHALPPLTNSQNEPTGAIVGVMNMLRKLQQAYAGSHFCVTFDAKGKNFRHELFSEYKANRSEMPEDLVPQVEPLKEIVKALGMPLLCVDGVEADDVIGTVAVLAQEAGFHVVISTGDKDMAQLVNDQVELVNTMSGTAMDVAGVEAKFGVQPTQIIDYLTLMGDSVDNIPGVPKVGPKTAVKWLQAYGSLDGVIAAANEIKGKVGENLRASLSQLPLSKELVTIRCDVPLTLAVDDMVMGTLDEAILESFFQRFEFKSWLVELKAGNLFSPARVEQPCVYETVLTTTALNKWLDKIAKSALFAFDLETTSLALHEAEIVGVSLSTSAASAAYIPVGHDYDGAPQQLSRDEVLAALKPFWQSETLTKLAHNLKYDLSVLANYDITVRGPLQDSMLASYVNDSAANRHDMDTLANKYLHRSTTKFEQVAGKGVKQVTFNQVNIADAAPYACEDADVCWQLFHYFEPLLLANEKLASLYQTLEIPLVSILSKMERGGVMIDTAELSRQSECLAGQIEQRQQQIYQVAGMEFNIDSPKQLQEVLYEKLSLPVLAKTPKGQPSTAESVLSDLAHEHELPAMILRYRSLHKLKSTYVDKLPQQINPKTGRIHASFHQAVTATGRLSSSDPNLQNIPIRSEEGRAIRRAFIVPTDYSLVALDYSQIELRIMAHLSGDETLLKAFAANADIHKITAAEVFAVALDAVSADQRRSAKAINFGLIYGMSAFGLAKQLGVSRDAAQSYIDLYFQRYPGVKRYMDETKAKAAEQGFVETLLGRRLYLPEIKSQIFNRRQAAERTAINAPMQGTAADIIKLAMIHIDQWLQSQTKDIRLLIQVHDELVFEMPTVCLDNAVPKLVELMESALPLAVPLLVSAGSGANWQEAH